MPWLYEDQIGFSVHRRSVWVGGLACAESGTCILITNKRQRHMEYGYMYEISFEYYEKDVCPILVLVPAWANIPAEPGWSGPVV